MVYIGDKFIVFSDVTFPFVPKEPKIFLSFQYDILQQIIASWYRNKGSQECASATECHVTTDIGLYSYWTGDLFRALCHIFGTVSYSNLLFSGPHSVTVGFV